VTAASYSEFASIHSENGGGYLFSSRTFDNDLLLFGVGASLFMGYCATTAFYLGTMNHWMSEFVMASVWDLLGLDVHPPGGVWGILTALVLGSLNARGTEESGTFQVMVTGAKVAVLFAFIGGAVASVGPTQSVSTFTTSFQLDPAGIVSIAAVAFITFFGFSAIAASAGEIIEPRRTVPLAIAASILTVTVLYTFVIVAMVNTPVPDSVLQAGETAMGKVAASFSALGGWGQPLIVAGAIFSMVSASNASILAASSIGSLMGSQGQAPRSFSRLHPEYSTPFWSVATATGVIALLIAVFVGLFPAEGGFSSAVPFDLGLGGLTGFANVNLLAPLAVVNAALIANRRKFPDIDRPLTVPASPWLPIVGILANVALITNLPLIGIVIGVGVETALVAGYLVWGGAPNREELVEKTVRARKVAAAGAGGRTGRGGVRVSGESDTSATGAETDVEGEAAVTESVAVDPDRYQILVPIERIGRAEGYARLASAIGRLHDDDPVVRLLNVTQIPEQTESAAVVDTAQGRADRITEELSEVEDELDATVLVEGHICRDVSFDILSTARDEAVDRILMGYPEKRRDITESIEYKAPCDVMFLDGVDDLIDLSTVIIGAGGGPHHEGLLDLATVLADHGTEVHVVNATPTGGTGTAEEAEATLDRPPSRRETTER
jgi:amino acid transporter